MTRNKPTETIHQNRRWRIHSRIVLILGCAFLLSSCKPRAEKDAEKIPVQFVFEAPGVSIPIRYLPDPQPGGLNPAQVDILKLLLGSVPPTLLKGVKFIALYPATDLPNTATGEAGGLATADGAIIIRTPVSAATPDALNNVLTHEIGHTVESRVLNSLERIIWQRLHAKSTQRGDFVSDYAQTNEKEDFAETFRAWMSGSRALLYGAVYGGALHPVLLQKLLYMASLFTNAAAHTVTFYPTAIDFTSEQVTYTFTPDTLTLDPVPTGGAYGGQLGLTFHIQNHAIVSESFITGTQGSSPVYTTYTFATPIPIPSIVYSRMSMTGDSAAVVRSSTTTSAATTDVSSPQESLRPPGKISIKVISPFAPSQYIPLMSPKGAKALAAEKSMINHPNQLPSTKDEIRSHLGETTSQTQSSH